MRVLIADKLPDAARTRLQEVGFTVVFDPSLSGTSLQEALTAQQPDVLIVRSTRVQQSHFEAGRALQLVVRAGAGVNTIDLDTASARGVFVSNCPGMNAVAVAELTMGHLINADRRIADNVADLRAAQWKKKDYSKAEGLKGRTLGLIGTGSIAREVARRALAFDMNVIMYSPSFTADEAAKLGVRRADNGVDVARQSDALSVHIALTEATRHLVGDAIFNALGPGGIFINTSRGGVVDQDALVRAVRDTGIRAGLDVFWSEPAGDGEWETELAALPGVYGTHHIGASTNQAQTAVANEALRVICRFRDTGEAINCVNLADSTPATHLLVVRHADRVGVLAQVLDHLRREHINVQQMQNIVFRGAQAACARIQLDTPAPDSLMDELRATPEIFDVALVPLES